MSPSGMASLCFFSSFSTCAGLFNSVNSCSAKAPRFNNAPVAAYSSTHCRVARFGTIFQPGTSTPASSSVTAISRASLIQPSSSSMLANASVRRSTLTALMFSRLARSTAPFTSGQIDLAAHQRQWSPEASEASGCCAARTAMISSASKRRTRSRSVTQRRTCGGCTMITSTVLTPSKAQRVVAVRRAAAV